MYLYCIITIMNTVNLKNATQESIFSLPADTRILHIDQSPSLDEIRLPHLPVLTELHISRSGKSVKSFDSVPNLCILTVTNTSFVSIESSIGNLRSLTKLAISLNFLLTELPVSLGDLSRLENLEISYTAISDFPESLAHLHQLRVLRLSGNELRRVPDFVHRLPYLTELHLDDNDIRIVPDTFIKLTRLERLFISNNPRLEYIPPFLLRLAEYDKLPYEHGMYTRMRQTQKTVLAKQRTLRLIRKPTPPSSKETSHGMARDPILMRDVNVDAWISESPKDNFILEHRESGQTYALKKSYFKTVVPYFVLESCNKSSGNKTKSKSRITVSSSSTKAEYISIEKYGIPIPAILPMASIRYLSSSAFSRFRISVSDRDFINTRPKLLINNTVLHVSSDLHAEHISVMPDTLIPYIRSYSHRWDTYINHFLRSGLSIDKYAVENPRFHVEFAASIKEGKRQLVDFIDYLDNAFEKYAEVSDTDIAVFRGTKDALDLPPYLGIVAGFTSTSTNRIVAEQFSSQDHNCCVYRLIISPGVPFISVKKYSQHSTEDELLLPRGIFMELIDTIQPIDDTYIKEYVVRIRPVSKEQFAKHKYVCKTYPLGSISAVHK